jgi:hypothetical protein
MNTDIVIVGFFSMTMTMTKRYGYQEVVGSRANFSENMTEIEWL